MVRLNGATKLAKLRELMKSTSVGTCSCGVDGKGIDALIVNAEDAHQSEYLAKQDERRQFITGFKGSTGTAVITADRALLWTDGRYFTQALAELDPPEAWTLVKDGVPGTPTQAAWLISNLPPKSTVAADPNFLSYAVWAPLHESLTAAGHCLIPLRENLVDLVWGDEKPAAVLEKIVPHPFNYSGMRACEKVAVCRTAMKKNNVVTLVIPRLDEVAYLLNWRGSDIPYNPVFFAYVIITPLELHIFVEMSRVTAEAERQLRDEGVDAEYHPYEDLHAFLRDRISSSSSEGGQVWINSHASFALHAQCVNARQHIAISPVSLMKLVKNPTEIEGMKAAHVRDAVALVKYFAWLEKTLKNKDDDYPVTEISGATRLEAFRRQQDAYVGLSFSTISSVGPHGAIIHYNPSTETDVPITDQELYLCDSGAQYLDGTTDVTRTLHFGVPTDYERECFTRVFKGQSFLSTAVFPSMIKGNYLDTLARKSLWDVGLDYLHGTGHGVGAYLNVHEDPTGISWRPYPDDPGLQTGIFISNEPGFYENGKFGIRLENIELVVKANTPYNYNNRDYLTFETVTLVPIQTSLLDVSLLNDKEVQHLNGYHEKCLTTLRPLLQGEENADALAWLERETQPMSR